MGFQSKKPRREIGRLHEMRVMLHDLLDTYRDAIIARTREKLTHRSWPPSPGALENGVPLFLKQVAETLKLEQSEIAFAPACLSGSVDKISRLSTGPH